MPFTTTEDMPKRRFHALRRLAPLSAASARICRNGAIMFVLLLGMPLLPLGEHGWLWFPLLLVLAVLFQAIVRDVVGMWKRGAWGRRRSADAGADLQLEPAPRAPRREPDWDTFVWPPPPKQEPDPAPPAPTLHTPLAASRAQPRAPLPEPAPAAASDAREWRGGLLLHVRELKQSTVDIEIEAGDDHLAARTRVQVDLEEALRFGDALRGFPADESDRRDVMLGTFAPAASSGGLRLVLFCRDGGARIYATLWPELRPHGGTRQTVSVSFSVDLEAFTQFVTAMAAAPLQPGARVELAMAQAGPPR